MVLLALLAGQGVPAALARQFPGVECVNDIFSGRGDRAARGSR